MQYMSINRQQIQNHHLLNISDQDKLIHIITTSYAILLGQIGNGRILIQNEASMQLHLAYIKISWRINAVF
jgi:hypothetical protein